jgi:hypothetical protein
MIDKKREKTAERTQIKAAIIITLMLLGRVILSPGSVFSSPFPPLSPDSAGYVKSQPADRAPWPHEISDLEPDPAVIFGRLSNGFRYVLMTNQRP